MIGPGTGIAPFRAFLAERDSTGATGKNWLFFGDQHFTTDFLYQSEIQDWARTGVLTRINTAFSRDQEHKVYVQHKMQKHATELFDWLRVRRPRLCLRGKRTHEHRRGKYPAVNHPAGRRTGTTAQAETFLDELKDSGRYIKDVY